MKLKGFGKIKAFYSTYQMGCTCQC